MYYSVKLNWQQPKDGTDEMQKLSKLFLVEALSVTEAEAKIIDWIPSNYQDAVVDEVKKTNIGELRLAGASETFWLIKVMDDFDGRAKPKPYFVVYNGEHMLEIVKTATTDWNNSEIEEVKRFKQIVDDDLISPEPVKRSASHKAAVEDTAEDIDDDGDYETTPLPVEDGEI